MFFLWGPCESGSSLIQTGLRLCDEEVTSSLDEVATVAFRRALTSFGTLTQQCSHTMVIESHSLSDWSGFWAKKIPTPKFQQQAQGLQSLSVRCSGFKQLQNYRAMPTGSTAAVTISECRELINQKVCHSVIVPDLGMCGCQQEHRNCTLTPCGKSLYLLYN